MKTNENDIHEIMYLLSVAFSIVEDSNSTI